RRWAAFALGEIGFKAAPAVPELIELLRDPSVITRTIAAAAVRRIGPDTLSPLVSALKDDEAHLRRQVASLLGGYSEQADLLLPVLHEASADPDPDVRESVARALRRLAANAPVQAATAQPPIAPSLVPVD
ncbi:MAG TPA: HEAT repeat domain-containing protein, partial [Gemmataceae bacterium]|nr:HEAT repeat domain-containing protein [Gemmataceae bacterium]